MRIHNTAQKSRIHVVAREDRLAEFAGVRLLLASLQRHASQVSVSLYLKEEHLGLEGARLQNIHPGVKLVPFDHAGGWACKPAVMLHALEQEEDDDTLVLWLDTDIIVLRDFSQLAEINVTHVLSAEESNPNANGEVQARQRLLGLPVGNPRETTISSAVVGVRKSHTALIQAWARGVETEAYLHQQTLPYSERLLFGDQEVWEATLCSESFRDIPVTMLRNFNELLQATYTSHVSSKNIKRRVEPYFVHATGNLKPWRKSRLRLAQEIFPYFDHAQSYLSQLGPRDLRAFKARSPAALGLKLLGGFGAYTKMRRAHHWFSTRRHTSAFS